MLNEYLSELDFNGIEYQRDVSLSSYCTYGTGGKASVMVFPLNAEQLKKCAFEKSVVIGYGSNVLFSDAGFKGVVINTTKMKDISIKGTAVTAESGVSLFDLRESCYLNCLGGLEFTEGIPASVGGAVAMNVGCFSKSISELVSYVVTNNRIYNNVECEFGYRTSIFLSKPNEIIIKVCFLLKPSEMDIIEGKREKFKKLRKSSQPHGRSCGSVFLNDGYFAGKLIDLANLKGYKIGGAKISEKHANFIINDGGSSTDVYKLISHVKKVVYETHGIKLKEELRYIGEFND